MIKRLLAFFLISYLLVLAIGSLFGIHGHDDTGILSIHTHKQTVAINPHFIEHDAFLHVETPHIEEDHPESHKGSISILVYLIGHKTNLNASILSILPVKYFSSSRVIDNNRKLTNPPLFLQFLCNNQTASLTNRISSCYISARAPPFYS